MRTKQPNARKGFPGSHVVLAASGAPHVNGVLHDETTPLARGAGQRLSPAPWA